MAEYDAWTDYYDYVHLGLEGEAEFYVGQAVRIGGPALELGCGTGRIAIPMAMTGVDATGLDMSGAMLERCRDKLEAVSPVEGSLELVEGDMTEFELERTFDFIAIPYRSFMHLMTSEAQRSCLKCVRRHLNEQGTLILNLWAAKPSAIAAQLNTDDDQLEYVGRYPVPGTEISMLDHCAAEYNEFAQSLVEEHLLQEIDGDGNVLGTETLHLTRTWLTYREMDNLVRL
ncbi:MAG: class I SAM-dependent methyltransferase, partial [bacterium]|nr:class I SAM-dependent methyltransferase [bacterium]